MTGINVINAVAGGMLIGLASVILMGLTGRIAGVSGILGGLVTGAADRSWRITFIGGLVSGGFLFQLLTGALPVQLEAQGWQLISAGVLVGFGTRLGSGCTSGHGVCGIARFSPRSITATLVFIGCGMLTVYLTRHIL